MLLSMHALPPDHAGTLQVAEIGPAAEAEGRAVWVATEALTAGLAADLAEQLRCASLFNVCILSALHLLVHGFSGRAAVPDIICTMWRSKLNSLTPCPRSQLMLVLLKNAASGSFWSRHLRAGWRETTAPASGSTCAA